MDAPGQQILAHAGFSQNEHRRVGDGRAVRLAQHVVEPGPVVGLIQGGHALGGHAAPFFHGIQGLAHAFLQTPGGLQLPRQQAAQLAEYFRALGADVAGEKLALQKKKPRAGIGNRQRQIYSCAPRGARGFA